MQYLGENIAAIKERILYESKRDFNEWLLNIRTHCGEIGKFSLEQTQAQMRMDKRRHISTRSIDVESFSNNSKNEKKSIVEDEEDQNIINGMYIVYYTSSSFLYCILYIIIILILYIIHIDHSYIEMNISESLFDNSKFKIEFTALYQCVHVYEYMDMLDEFISYYRENRKVM